MADLLAAWLEVHNFAPTTAIAGVEVPTVLLLALCFLAPFLFGRTLSDSGSASAAVAKVITKDRRSVVKYSGKAAPEAAIQKALVAATHAPNHWLNEPWRFYRLGPKSRAQLGVLNPGKVATFASVPDMLVVTCAPSMEMKVHSMAADKTPWDGAWGKCALEDHAATAAAVQNLLLSLASDGVGTKWMTGAMGIAPADIMKLVRADDKAEHFMGVIFVGMPEVPTSTMKAPKRQKGLEGGIVSFCE